MGRSNGETKVEKVLTNEEKLDLIIEALADINSQIADLAEQQRELYDRVAMLSLDSEGFVVYEES